jgi:hypothetical protein
MCQDYWKRGYKKVVVDPSIFVVYNQENIEGKLKSFNFIVKSQTDQIRPSIFIQSPPQRVYCCDLIDSFMRESSDRCSLQYKQIKFFFFFNN